jgi:hypothetical protein
MPAPSACSTRKRPVRSNRSASPVRRGDQHADVEHARDLGRDPAEVAALEHDLGQSGMERVDGYQLLGQIRGFHWQNLTSANSSAAR